MLRNIILVNGGYHSVHKAAQHNRNQLNQNISGISVKLLRTGCAGDDDTAGTGGNQAQNQQHPVSLFGEVFQFFNKLMQENSSLGSDMWIIPPFRQKVNRRTVNTAQKGLSWDSPLANRIRLIS